jgi:hypothetical protein
MEEWKSGSVEVWKYQCEIVEIGCANDHLEFDSNVVYQKELYALRFTL